MESVPIDQAQLPADGLGHLGVLPAVPSADVTSMGELFKGPEGGDSLAGLE
jgi:hypothetical protein